MKICQIISIKPVAKLAVILFFFISFSNYAAQCNAQCQLTKIKVYFHHLDNISRSGSTTKNIDLLLNNMHQDVRYQHIEYQADFNKTEWRKAFIRNLTRGAYQKSVAYETRILNSIIGKNHIAIEYAHGVVAQNGTWRSKNPQLVVFSFTDGKISLIKELW